MGALPADDERTVFQPQATEPPLSDAVAPPPRHGRSGLPPGVLLNNIYEVRRFLARGGMGEVYEGVNVNTDERVAIKVMLPHLAADPKVQAMFRKEARILTELAHPALVRYRVLAHEPQLELFYIVTEFIDGRALSDLLGELRPDPDALKALIRRLAEGLAVAHAHGAVHRDMSPDNVLLPQGRLDQAKIIDFGIARESSLAHHTVVGDGFAGKLGYVAPEQFGDFGRRIGPWTDIYSLGLVGLALASERAPDMGVTLVDAVDRRRQGVDLAPLPASLRPIFEKMLAPDPSDRFQTMAEVIAAIDGSTPRPAPVTAPATARAPLTGSLEVEEAEPAPAGRSKWIWAVLAGVAAVAVVAVGIGVTRQPKPKADVLSSTVPIAAPVEAEAAAATPAEATPVPAEPVPEPVKAIAPATGPKPKRPAAQIAQAQPYIAAPAAPIVAVPQVAPAAPIALNAPAEAATSVAEKGVEACWKAVGGDWNYIGYASRGSCAAQAFSSCQVVHGRWGKTQLRRYDGKLQAKGTGILSKWQAIAPSQCPASASATP